MIDRHGMIRPYETEVDFASRLADMVWISVALWISTAVFGEPWQNAESLAAVGASLLFYLFAVRRGRAPALSTAALPGLQPALIATALILAF